VGADRLAVEGLSVAYGGSRVVRAIALRVAPGETVALLGRNGAGKSSTLLAIAGAIVPAAGTVRVDGVFVQGRPPYAIARRGVSLVPQGRRIFPTLTVRENLMLGDRGGSVAEMLALFPALAPRMGVRGAALSGGEQQMLAIARALMTRPRLLLMDEPSEGLAPVVLREVEALAGRLGRDQELSILIAEQNLHLALAVADRVYVLERGEVVYEGSAAGFRADRTVQHRYLGV